MRARPSPVPVLAPLGRPALLLSALLLAAGACSREPAEERSDTEAGRAAKAIPQDTVAPPEAVARARTAANGLGQDLQKRLFAALDSGGPKGAVAFCADSAQALSARHAREGVYIRRVSLRTRNPRNAPDSIEARELRLLDSLHRAGATPGEIVRTERMPDGARVVAYMRPIMVQERCLACHGDPAKLAPGVREILAERYPDDMATGYKAGDLRGMISVRVRRDAAGGAPGVVQ